MSKLNNKKIGMLAGTAALVMVAAGSLAYFTDRANLSAEGKAGSVRIDYIDKNVKLTDKDGKNILNPGDKRTVNFVTENQGNKSVDVRETIKLTSTVSMTGDADNQSEFELYDINDVEFVTGRGYAPKAGAKPLAVKSISSDGKIITYNVPEYILDGNQKFKEREQEDGAHDDTYTPPTPENLKPGELAPSAGPRTDTYTHNYVLVFKGEAGNNFQDAGVKLEVLTEAKQHRNTSAGWDIVSKSEYTFGNTEKTQAVVPAEVPGV